MAGNYLVIRSTLRTVTAFWNINVGKLVRLTVLVNSIGGSKNSDHMEAITFYRCSYFDHLLSKNKGITDN